MSPHEYSAPATNRLSGNAFDARVVAHGPAPRVHSVTIRPWNWEAAESAEVIVHFDPADLPDGPARPFSFDVTCTTADDTGRRLQVSDGDNELRSLAKIDPDYTIRSEVYATRWSNVSDLEVTVTVGPPT
jgi:hypothetical protein